MRAFVAVDVTRPEIVESIASLQSEMGTAGRAVRPENLHFTLRFLGDLPAPRIKGVADALAGVEFRAFEVTVRGAGTFGGKNPRIVWAGTDPGGGRLLGDLARAVNGALDPLLPPADGPFRPHLTLARIKRGGPPEGLLERHADTVWGTQPVDAIKLKESVLAPTGPTYTDVAEVRAWG